MKIGDEDSRRCARCGSSERVCERCGLCRRCDSHVRRKQPLPRSRGWELSEYCEAEGEDLTPKVMARLIREEGFAAADLRTYAEQGFRWNPRTQSLVPKAGR